jgi:hypothetical protein
MEKLAGIAVVLVIGGIVFWGKYNDKSETRAEYNTLILEVLETADGYDEHKSDYNHYFRLHHEECFDRHYRMGGRRTPASFNELAYWNDLLREMIREARAEDNEEVVKGLEALNKRLMEE